MTKILTAKGEELSMVLGEVLRKGRHDWNMYPDVDMARCFICGAGKDSRDKPCTIPLDWPNAMKYRDWAVEKFGEEVFRKACLDVYNYVEMRSTGYVSTGGSMAPEFFAQKAQPEHYLQASARCVEMSKA